MDTNNFVPGDDCDFHSITKLVRTTENKFSYFLGVIWNYVKKTYGCIVPTSEDP